MRSQRWPRLFFSGVAVTAIATFALFSQPRAIHALQSTGNFEASFVDGSRLMQMASSQGTLYVLVRSRTGAEIIRFDPSGQVRDRASVHQKTVGFTVAPDGSVTMLRHEGSRSIISGPLFQTAQHFTERTVTGLIERLATLAGNPVGITDSSVRTGLTAGGQSQIPVSVQAPHRTLSLPDGSLAVIGSRDPMLSKLYASGHVSSPVALVAPDLRHFRLPESELSVIDVAAHQNGDLLLAASPYSPTEGARILRFDANGNFKLGLRLLMPRFPEITTAVDGRLGVGKMALVGNRLFLGSSTSTAVRIAYFDLDMK